jgi:hypothetical protein
MRKIMMVLKKKVLKTLLLKCIEMKNLCAIFYNSNIVSIIFINYV